MDKTRKILLSEFYGACLITLIIIGVYELRLVLPGNWADVESAKMVGLQFLMQLLTLAAIPLALFPLQDRLRADAFCSRMRASQS